MLPYPFLTSAQLYSRVGNLIYGTNIHLVVQMGQIFQIEIMIKQPKPYKTLVRLL